MRIGHLNVNSIRNKILLVSDFIFEHNIDILCLTETKLTDGISLIKIPGFTMVRQDRTEHGGGVAVLFRTSIKFSITTAHLFSEETKLEYITLKFQVHKLKSFSVTCVYRPKFSLSDTDILNLETLFTNLGNDQCEYYICGDLNIHLEDDKPHVKKFKRLMHRMNATKVVGSATRGTAHIDVVITNVQTTEQALVVEPGISDHEAVIVERNFQRIPRIYRKIQFRPFASLDMASLAEKNIALFRTFDTTRAVNELLSDFIELHLSIFNELCPVVNKLIRVKDKPISLSTETREIKKWRDSVYRSYKQFPNITTKQLLLQLNKEIRIRIVRDTRDKIGQDISEKGVWEVRKRLLKPIQPECIIEADKLNEHYASISNEPVSGTCPMKPSGLITPNDKFAFRRMSEFEVLLIYKSMKHKLKHVPDYTGFAPIMLSLTIHNPDTLTALAAIINRSLLTNTFPSMIKTGIITPSAKVPNPQHPKDYRPIAEQSPLSLLIEKCAQIQIVDWLKEKKLLYDLQFGFRSGHSCETAMISLTEFMYKQIDKGNICILVALDLSKAFDVIVREFLFEKLKWYGIEPGWVESYLTLRTQVVRNADGTLSGIKSTLRGCPQGSVMGPLVFQIYINDLPFAFKDSLCIIFADDTNLCISGPPSRLPHLIKLIEGDLMSAVDWMRQGGMKLNVEKTQVMVLGSSHNLKSIGHIEIEIDGIKIKSTDKIKCLGLTIDAKLKWVTHINSISQRAHLMCKSLYPLKKLISIEHFILLMNASVISLVSYMAVIWGSAEVKYLKIVERTLRSAARYIFSIRKTDPISEIIKTKLRWLMPQKLYMYRSLCFIQKTMHEPPPCFTNMILRNEDIHHYNTRSSKDIHLSMQPKRSVQFLPVSAWNDLPEDLKNCLNYSKFKRMLKNLLLTD